MDFTKELVLCTMAATMLVFIIAEVISMRKTRKKKRQTIKNLLSL